MTLIEEMVAEATNNQMADGQYLQARYLPAGRLLMEGAKKIWHLERRIEELESELVAMRGGGIAPKPQEDFEEQS